jgi:hypothetical protein
MRGHLWVLVANIPLSIETESEGSPHKPQSLISIGFPRVFTREYLSETAILFVKHRAFHYSINFSL